MFDEDEPDIEIIRKKTHKSLETLREHLKLYAQRVLYHRRKIEDLVAAEGNQQKLPRQGGKKLRY